MSEIDQINTQFTAARRRGTEEAERIRIGLLTDASRSLDPQRFASLLQRCWRGGDLREQRAVLRALPALTEPEKHVRIAAEGARSNLTSLFEAIAVDNSYPSRFFDERAYNQLVMKAVFVGVPVASIVGLAERMNPTLKRMAADLVSERRAAGRPVPADALVLAAGDSPARSSA